MQKIIDQLVQINRFEKEKGLDLDEIKALNENLEKNIPGFFTSYLNIFGFNDNLFGGIFNEEDDFVEQNEMIWELGFADYIAIGDAYNENLIVAHIENQKLFLIEDDHLIDLKMTFSEMLLQAVEALDSKKFEIIQQVNSVYESIQDYKNTLKNSFIESFSQLKATVSNNKDSIYGVVIAKDRALNLYNLYAGSLHTFKLKTEKETIAYDELWTPEKMDYKQAIPLNEILMNIKSETDFRALDLLFLDVLRDLKEDGYFSDQMNRFSISIQSNSVNLFPEDSYDESLTKDTHLETKIRRFWESPYDRTRLLMEIV
ncbi:hypothetical protein [Sphingobacterium yanglingense]|uniref:Uncharacterized protein n=1 Tax=Sphingobacterium yanglingense TaxID=1437280 RepID=A0A4R6W5D0_9SPHI|nr:hypothetical protein [Sphingobacterium yanglingense]TDQ73927.1 hypothetical protein CLV99_4365 [Sphingobacterium yanglingense]